MTIRIYDHSWVGVTSLFITEYDAPKYRLEHHTTGSFEFTVRCDNPKVTTSSLKMFNRVQFYENTTIRFTGYIEEVNYGLETITVRCIGLLGLLKSRITPFDYVYNGSINDMVNDAINAINGLEDTRIRTGQLDGAGIVSRKANGDDWWDVLTDAIEGTSNQFYFNHSTLELSVRPMVGRNLSGTILLSYDTRNVAFSNIAAFGVRDKADEITTISSGRVDSNTLRIEDSALIDKYGIVERNKAYRTIASTDLNTQLTSELSDSAYSIDVTLAPTVSDAFDIGDIIRIKLYNGIIDIDSSYQVVTKEVDYQGYEKTIRVKINKEQSDILDIISRHGKDIKTLSNNT